MYIFGAGILGEIALETALRSGKKVKGFIDDISPYTEFLGFPIYGNFNDLKNGKIPFVNEIFVAIGNNKKRKACVESLRLYEINFPNLIDPNAVISPTATIGEGNLILPNAYIGTKCSLDSYNVIFPGVSITHHNKIGSYCFFSPNASIGGFTKIGNCCKVGMNCVVLPYNEIKSEQEFSPLSIIK